MIKQVQCLASSQSPLRKLVKPPVEFIEDIDQLNPEPGIVWVLEVDGTVPDLQSLSERPPMAVCLKSRDPRVYKEVVRNLHPDIILLEDELDTVQEAVEKLESQLLIRTKRRQQHRSVADRNKELQILAQNLERLVEERTRWIESSNREQRELIRNERRFVQFLIKIGLQNAKEDLLEAFVQEFRQLRLVQEIYLIHQKKEEIQLEFLRNNEIHCLNLPEIWWASQDVETLPESAVRNLAKKFGRPVGRLIAFPLPSIREKTAQEGFSGLLIEKGTTGPLSESEYTLIKKYVQALGLSLERITLEEDSRISALIWEKVFDAAQDPIAIISENFDVVRSNQIFGEAQVGKKCYEIWAGRTQPCERCPIVEKTSSPQEISHHDHFFQVVSRKLESEERVYLHRYVDVTESRQAHIRFIQNEKLTSIGQIAEQMAHEIYNPLAGIIALVQILLADNKTDGTTRTDLIEIQKAAIRAQKVIENLQDFVKQEGNVVETTFEEIVEKTLPLLKMKWRAFRLNLNLNSADTKFSVQPQLISQVIYNLIQNACQAMTPGQTLTLSSQVLKDRVQLTVQDEGTGIPKEMQSSIFKPFFTTKLQGEGTGLGLSLSKQIVERFKGHLYFESQPGAGTTFFLEIPIENTH